MRYDKWRSFIPRSAVLEPSPSSPALLLGLVSVVVSLPFWPDRSLGSGPVLARLDATSTAQPAPNTEQDEDEREVAKLALRDNCLICHSEEMVAL